MKKQFPNPRSKPYFCHDENLEFYSLRKECNKQARFISIIKLSKKQGALDPVVIDLCQKSNYHVATHNTKDFRNPTNSISIGIICIGLKHEYYWIPKFKRLLSTYKNHKDYYNKTVLIGEAITIKNRITKDVRVL